MCPPRNGPSGKIFFMVCPKILYKQFLNYFLKYYKKMVSSKNDTVCFIAKAEAM